MESQGSGDSVDSNHFEDTDIEIIPVGKLREYRAIFDVIDEDGSGDVSVEEFRSVFKRVGVKITEEELDELLQELNADRDEGIGFEGMQNRHRSLFVQRRAQSLPYLSTDYQRDESPIMVEVDINSMMTQVVAGIVLGVIGISTLAFVLETMPGLAHSDNSSAFFAIDAVCVAVFTLEFVARLVGAPSLKRFSLSVTNMIDLAAILPFYLELMVGDDSLGPGLRVFRVLRVLRLVKAARYIPWFIVFSKTAHTAVAPMGMVIFIVSVLMIVLSSGMYFLERGTLDTTSGEYMVEGVISKFISIPMAFWWCIVTLTTIGFGEIVPLTVGGKLVATLTSLIGITLLAIPISVLSASFTTEYAKMRKARRIAAEQEEKLAQEQLEDGKRLSAESHEEGGQTDNNSQRWGQLIAADDVSLASESLAGRERDTMTDRQPSSDRSAASARRAAKGDSGLVRTGLTVDTAGDDATISARSTRKELGRVRGGWSMVYLRSLLEVVSGSGRKCLSSAKQIEFVSRQSLQRDLSSSIDAFFGAKSDDMLRKAAALAFHEQHGTFRSTASSNRGSSRARGNLVSGASSRSAPRAGGALIGGNNWHSEDETSFVRPMGRRTSAGQTGW